MSGIRLLAPFGGWACPIDAVPDPVFAERMMGDGLAIDPLDGLLRSPCDATVIAIAPTRHSVTLRLANGAELLIHIGLETVTLGGEGFAALAKDGDAVKAGDPLIRFDMEVLALRAKSLITPIVVANEGFEITGLSLDRPVSPGDVLCEIRAVGGAAASSAVTGDDTAGCEIAIPMANGIHARPAARIAAALKPFASEVSFSAHGRSANAKSTVALLALGLRHGDAVSIAARGADARAAAATVAQLIESGMGEAHTPAQAQAAPVITADNPGPVFKGVRASPGLAIGPVFHLRTADADVPEKGVGVAEESAALDTALATLAAELAGAAGHGASIAAAHAALLEDPELVGEARTRIAHGESAGFAWRAATRTHADAIRATGDALLIERIADLKDIERRVIGALTGEGPPPAPVIPDGAIVVADELLPSQFLAFGTKLPTGICTARGGPTSHVAILAASAGVPMLVAVGPGVLDTPEGMRAILDADGESFDSAPDADSLARREAEHETLTIKRDTDRAAAQDACVLADGTRIEVFANLGSADDAARAVELGAEGCGLLRTEFLFLNRADAPSEDAQCAAYAAVAAALDGRPLIVRTLDIGGDKPVAYLPFPHEDNPALGNRGVRFSLAQPDLLEAQLRAILRGVPAAQCRIMIPMVMERGELTQVRSILDRARQTCGVTAHIPLGVMIETPAAALLAQSIAADADFLSVGTNDLTQYALAADRGNPALAARIDALHPAVLRLIALAGEGAAGHGRQLGICGGAASDPAAAAILVGLGATELSATPAAIPALKAALRGVSLNDCRALAKRALAAESAAEVRAMTGEQR